MADPQGDEHLAKGHVVSSEESVREEKVHAALAEIPDPDAGKTEEERAVLVSVMILRGGEQPKYTD